MARATQQFFAHGKLLISAEYTVLRGALALALPTTFGQYLHVEHQNEADKFFWYSIDESGKTWFSCVFDSTLEIVSATDSDAALRLQRLLRAAHVLNTEWEVAGFSATTTLAFPRNWGLGSSSTLVSLVAQWASVDALELFFKTQTGSGYDVACATANGAITYQLLEKRAQVEQVHFNPNFKDELGFVYLGEKQISHREVLDFKNKKTSPSQIDQISTLTKQLIEAPDLPAFESFLHQHELLTSKILARETIQNERFKDYPGIVKSLGAWGGDFVMATRTNRHLAYFSNKGYNTLLSWQQMFG